MPPLNPEADDVEMGTEHKARVYLTLVGSCLVSLVNLYALS